MDRVVERLCYSVADIQSIMIGGEVVHSWDEPVCQNGGKAPGTQYTLCAKFIVVQQSDRTVSAICHAYAPVIVAIYWVPTIVVQHAVQIVRLV